MKYLFMILYSAFCAHLLTVSINALFHMNRKTGHFRRAAFLSIAIGSVLSFLELIEYTYPYTSALLITFGISILFLIGSRERVKHAHNHSTQTRH